MSQLIPLAPLPVEFPVPAGTKVILDDGAKFLDRDLLTGGSPWRLLRLPGGSRAVAERWVAGGEVRAGEGRFARTLVQQGLLHPLHRGVADPDDVAVIVPIRDDVESLTTLLESLEGLHVTVVDDASSDGEAVARCAVRFGVDVVRLEVNLGPGRAPRHDRSSGSSTSTSVSTTHSTSSRDCSRILTTPSKAPSPRASGGRMARRYVTASKSDSVRWTWATEARS